MDTDLKQYLDDMERRLRAGSESMETRLFAHTEALETRLLAHAEAMETRLRVHVSEECEKVETRLLRNLYRESLVSVSEAAVSMGTSL